MRTFLVSYADGPRVHAQNQDALLRSAVGMGLDVLLAYRREHLPEAFRSRHHQILRWARGAGYWLWKPYLIQDCLRSADEGDVVVYLDAAVLVRQSLAPLIEEARRHELLLVENFHANRPYVKRDCYVLTGTDTPECHDARQLDAFCLFVKNTRGNREFVETWLDYCADPRILTDVANQCGRPDLPGFIAHRHDQAVLSLLYWRQRDGLAHRLCDRALVQRYLMHHRRRAALVPIPVWSRTPPRIRLWILRGPWPLRRRPRAVVGGPSAPPPQLETSARCSADRTD